MLLNGRQSEAKKETDFYTGLRKAMMVQEILREKLESIFGVAWNDSRMEEGKLEEIVCIMKYNAIVQILSTVDADNYKMNSIYDTISLQWTLC